MRRKFGTFIMILGAALIFAALSLLLWNQYEARQAEKSAQEILPRVIARIESPSGSPDGDAVYPDPYDAAMTEVEIDGYSYIGYLSIPSIDLELPVMSEWDYTRLKIAPCRYAGSTKTDDLVIAAHNYIRHFGQLKNVSPGDAVYFVDMDGILSAYVVAEVDTLAPTAVEEMTSGEYDLTLFTCTYGGKTRVTVRCERSEGQG